MLKNHDVRFVVDLYDEYLVISAVAFFSGKKSDEVRDILIHNRRSYQVKLSDILEKYYPPLYGFAIRNKAMGIKYLSSKLHIPATTLSDIINGNRGIGKKAEEKFRRYGCFTSEEMETMHNGSANLMHDNDIFN